LRRREVRIESRVPDAEIDDARARLGRRSVEPVEVARTRARIRDRERHEGALAMNRVVLVLRLARVVELEVREVRRRVAGHAVPDSLETRRNRRRLRLPREEDPEAAVLERPELI